MTDRVGKAAPAIRLRDVIRNEITKQMRSVDQISFGVVADAVDLEVLLDGMSVAVPVAWASMTPPALGDRVICASLRGGQQWIVLGSVTGGGGSISLDGLSDVVITTPALGDLLRFDGSEWVNFDGFPLSITTPALGDLLRFDGSEWVNFGGAWLPGETIYYTASGTFEKADYPGLRAVRVHCQGGGGGSGGMAATTATNSSAGRGGGGGGYARSLILVDDLDDSEAVTVGAGGLEGDATPGNGGDGGDSVFDTISGEVRGEGGEGGILGGASSSVGAGTEVAQPGNGTGDLVIRGQLGISIQRLVGTTVNAGAGGSSFMGVGGPAIANPAGAATGGNSGGKFGGGAGGRAQGGAILGAKTGSPGGDGIVIVELLF